MCKPVKAKWCYMTFPSRCALPLLWMLPRRKPPYGFEPGTPGIYINTISQWYFIINLANHCLEIPEMNNELTHALCSILEQLSRTMAFNLEFNIMMDAEDVINTQGSRKHAPDHWLFIHQLYHPIFKMTTSNWHNGRMHSIYTKIHNCP